MNWTWFLHVLVEPVEKRNNNLGFLQDLILVMIVLKDFKEERFLWCSLFLVLIKVMLFLFKTKRRKVTAECWLHYQCACESASMNVHSQFQGNQFDKSYNRKNRVSSNCKKNGHTISKYYIIIGFPKDFKFTKTRHFAANNCYWWQGYSKQINAFVPNHSQSSPGLTVYQHHELIQPLQQT